jgi:predicted ATP-grasp superfamily ATP-dependent carboligase
MRILVLDGEHRSALAALRALGRKGHQVYTASQLKRTACGFSRYCKGSVRYSSPNNNRSQFISDIKEHLKKLRIDVLLAMTDATMYRILQHENEIRKLVVIPAVSFEQYKRASDKCNLMKMAKRLNVEYPQTLYFRNAEQALLKKEQFEYPLVLKPQSSIIELNNRLVYCSVSIIDSPQMLYHVLTGRSYYQYPFMVQNFIRGEGLGVFVLCTNGELKAYCAHKRIREKPPWGGVSVVSESMIPSQSVLNNASVLLKELNWNGVAMVEFKNDLSGNIAKLMEINARFWGSLQLSIDAGIDFPNLLINMYCNSQFNHEQQMCNTRFRWLMGDLDNLIINFKKGNLKTRIKVLKSFIGEFFAGSKIEDFRYGDFKPFLWNLCTYCSKR